jgi:hypothetical protein
MDSFFTVNTDPKAAAKHKNYEEEQKSPKEKKTIPRHKKR